MSPLRRDALRVLLGSIQRETHILARHPELLASHLHNMLLVDERGTGPARLLMERASDAMAERTWLRLTGIPDVGRSALIRVIDHGGEVHSVAWSPDGRQLACGGGEATRTWNGLTGEPGVQLKVPSGSGNPRFGSIAWSPDGRMIAAIDTSELLSCWDSDSGELRVRASAYTMSWSPDGRFLASVDEDNAVRVWEASTGRPRSSLQAEPLQVGGGIRLTSNFRGAPAWSPDGTFIAWPSALSGSVRVWEWDSGPSITNLPEASSPLAWAPDGLRLATQGAAPGTVSVWSSQGHLESVLTTGSAWKPHVLTWTSDGGILAFGMEHDTLIVPETETIVCLWTTGWSRRTIVRIHAAGVCLPAWAPQVGLLAGARWDGRVAMWSPPGEPALAVFEGHRGQVTAVAWSPDARMVASAGADGTVRVWDATKTGKHSHARTGEHRGAIRAVALSPDGKRIASGGDDGTVRLWDEDQPDAPEVLEHPNSLQAVAWSPDGTTVAAADVTGIQIWDRGSGKELERPAQRTAPRSRLRSRRRSRVNRLEAAAVSALAWSRDGRALAIGDRDANVRVWRADDDAWITVTRHDVGAWISSLAWSLDGAVLASGGGRGAEGPWGEAPTRRGTGTVRLSRYETSRVGHAGPPSWAERAADEEWVGRHAGSVVALSWSPDDAFLASGAERLCLWADPDVVAASPPAGALDGMSWAEAAGTALRSLDDPDSLSKWRLSVWEGHEYVASLAWSPDGRYLASGGTEGSIRLWDPIGGECLAIAYCLSSVRDLGFDGGGHILKAADDGAATGGRPIRYTFELRTRASGR
jgi:WD40 repeat protein